MAVEAVCRPCRLTKEAVVAGLVCCTLFKFADVTSELWEQCSVLSGSGGRPDWVTKAADEPGKGVEAAGEPLEGGGTGGLPLDDDITGDLSSCGGGSAGGLPPGPGQDVFLR